MLHREQSTEKQGSNDVKLKAPTKEESILCGASLRQKKIKVLHLIIDLKKKEKQNRQIISLLNVFK